MAQFYAGRYIGSGTVDNVANSSQRDKTADELHHIGLQKIHKNGIDLSYFYSLSALSPRSNSMDKGVKLSAAERQDIKETLSQGIILEPGETESIRAAMRESSWLYNGITHMSVKELTGSAYSLGERKLYSGRTISGRFRRKLAANGSPYDLHETDSYIYIPWRDFTNLANITSAEKFEAILAGFFHEAIALDALRVGFNGRFASPETDPESWPSGEDVNKGWHVIGREYNNGSQVITDAIQLGEGGDFANLDSLANHLIDTRIPAVMRDHPGLVVLVGEELARKERLRLFDGSVSTSDAIAAQSGLDRVAGRFAIVPPSMPGKRLAVTTLSNLHMYTQEGTELYREGFSDEREYFWSLLRMDGYGLEDCTMYAAADEDAITLI